MEEGRRWEEMEMDCLVAIFGRLGVDDLILSIPFVCKSWSSASLDPLCWQVLDLRSLDFMPWSQLAKRFASRYSPSLFSFSSVLKYSVLRSSGSALQLRFPVVFCASIDDLTLASNECPRLQILTLPNLSLEDEGRIPELVGKWKELDLLELESKPSSFLRLAAQIGANCKKLRGLKMTGGIKREDAAAIVRHLPNIRHLNLSRSYLPKEQLLVLLNGCKGLERLSVNECVGFQAGDGEIKKKAVGVMKMFEDQGSKLVDDFDYDTDDCDPMYVCVI